MHSKTPIHSLEDKDHLDKLKTPLSLSGYCAEFIDEGNTLIDCTLDSGSSDGFWQDLDDPSAGPIVGLDYLDGLCPLFVGLELTNGKRQYQPTQMKIKKALSIVAAGVDFTPTLDKLLLDYGINALSVITPLAGPANLVAASLEFIIAAINYYNAAKEVTFEGWLEERTIEVNYLNKKIEKLGSKLKTISEEDSESSHIKTKQDALKVQRNTLQTKKETILSDIQSRSKVYYHANIQDEKNKELISRSRRLIINKQLEKINNNKDRDRAKISYLEKPTLADEKRDAEIQDQLNKRYYDTRGRFYIRACSLFAMSLLFVGCSVGCPPLIIVATVLSYMAVTAYLCNYGYKAIKSDQQPKSEKNKMLTRRHSLDSHIVFFNAGNKDDKNDKMKGGLFDTSNSKLMRSRSMSAF
jgi:hypothetical protein